VRTIRDWIYSLLHRPLWRRLLTCIPAIRRLHGGAHLSHPLDRHYGIDTGGFMPPDLLVADPATAPLISAYLASSPELLRLVLKSIGGLSQMTFLDCGCGKGRALAVAAEFPFRRIIGVEISDPIFAVLARNMAAIGREDIEIIQADIRSVLLPDGDLLLYLYNPFGQEILAELAEKMRRHIAAGKGKLFCIYVNPIWREVFDQAPYLRFVGLIEAPSVSADRQYGLTAHDMQAVLFESITGQESVAAKSRIADL
jgi:SAM-dependent methyltransferase